MAISYEMAMYLWTEIKQRKSTRILDLGSGFSSFIFRSYQESVEGCRVISVDTSADWLLKSNEFLEKNNLDVSEIYTFDEFKELPYETYDFILYDLGNMKTRSDNLEFILNFADKNCPVIVDDVHKKPYMDVVIETANRLKKKIVNIKPETFDSYGRFALLLK